MNSFQPGFLERVPLDHGLVQTIRSLGEFRGRQALYARQSPQVLERLREIAVIQSTESSNRIEGVTAPIERIRALVAEKTAPRDRSEQEIAGYRDVLKTIHASHADMVFTPGLVRQLHRDLYQFTAVEGGDWKATSNDITETRPDGTVVVRFRPLAPHLTPEAMDELHARFDERWHAGELEPLILIATYVLDFLCIHPFRDGNGRMARLLSLLLLYRAGDEVGRYVSLEKMVEDTRESYYDTLHASSQGWHEGAHDLRPWWEYFAGVMLLGAYREFEDRAGMLTTVRGAKRDAVIDAVERLPRAFRLGDVERICPGVSRPTINRTLRQLRDEGRIQCTRGGRDALWEKT